MALGLLIGSAFALAQPVKVEPAGRYSRLGVTPVSIPWSDRQFVQADKEGRVFLLRGGTLDLYEILSDGRLRSLGAIVREKGAEKRPPVREATMSSSGDVWVLFAFPNKLDVVRSGRREPVEAPWMVSAAAVLGGNPLVAAFPAEMATGIPGSLRLEAPPFLQEWDGKRWSTLVEGRFPDRTPDGVSRLDFLRGEISVFLAVTPERRLWVADEHLYRLRHFSASGALKDELVVGQSEVAWKERSAGELADAEARARKSGLPVRRGSLSRGHAESRIFGMTIGRDGAVYMVVSTEGGLALDRFHPALLTLDRVLLSGVEAPTARLTLAAGRQGLFIAALSSRTGLWRIDSEALDKADWKPVDDAATLNGLTLPVPVQSPAP